MGNLLSASANKAVKNSSPGLWPNFAQDHRVSAKSWAENMGNLRIISFNTTMIRSSPGWQPKAAHVRNIVANTPVLRAGICCTMEPNKSLICRFNTSGALTPLREILAICSNMALMWTSSRLQDHEAANCTNSAAVSARINSNVSNADKSPADLPPKRRGIFNPEPEN